MGTKKVQMKFQVVADDGVSANVTIAVNSTQVFSGALAHTADVMPGQVTDDQTPFSLVEFDLDVTDMPVPPGVPNSQQGWWATPENVTISVTGGSITLQATEANYSASLGEVAPPTTPPTFQLVPGSADSFVPLWFANQPVWTPTCVGRLNYEDNTDTGPGSLLLLDGESVSYQVAMTLYSA